MTPDATDPETPRVAAVCVYGDMVPYAVAAAAGLTWLGYPEAVSWRLSVLGAFFGGGMLLLVGTFWKNSSASSIVISRISAIDRPA